MTKVNKMNQIVFCNPICTSKSDMTVESFILNIINVSVSATISLLDSEERVTIETTKKN